jgi:transposase
MAGDRDFRKLDASAQAEVRRMAVAAAAAGVNRRFVGEWVQAEKQHGATALVNRKRGRRPGEQKTLQYDEEMKIRRLIADRCPDQLRLPFALWTREAVRLLIERRTCKRLSLSVIGRYLRAWGFTAQRPIRRATERCEADVSGGAAKELLGESTKRRC